MRIRNLLLVAVLALILIGVAYIRALFSYQDRPSVIPSEVQSTVPAALVDDYIRKDEAAARLDSLRQIYADSLKSLEQYWSAIAGTKSTAEADSLRHEITRFTEKLASAEVSAENAKKDKTTQFEKMVAAFYTGEKNNLPPDLSDYEREVSLKEIRNKAMKYFGISSKTLARIIKKYQ